MDVAQLIIAFTAGALAFLSPCSLPMLSAYVSYYIDRGEQRGRLLSGIVLAASMVVGFLLVFIVIGIIPSLVVSELAKWVWLAEPVIGVVLICLGFVTGWTNLLDRLPRVGLAADGGGFSFLAFGVAYGLASLGCSLPVFILVVLQGAAVRGFSDIIELFMAYGAGAAALIIPLTLTLTLTKELLHERLLSMLPYVRRINTAVLIIAGAYMVYAGLTR